MKVLTALPMNNTAAESCPAVQPPLGSAASIRQLAVAGSAAKRSMVDVTPGVGPAARAGRTVATDPAAAAAISKARRLTSMSALRPAMRGVTLAKRARGWLSLRPNRQLIAVGIEKMETPAAGKVEDRLGDPPARGLDPALRLGEILGVEDHQRPPGLRRCTGGEAALQAAIVELAIARPIVGEAPAESLAVEGFCALQGRNPELDVIDPAIILCL